MQRIHESLHLTVAAHANRIAGWWFIIQLDGTGDVLVFILDDRSQFWVKVNSKVNPVSESTFSLYDKEVLQIKDLKFRFP